MIIEKKKLKWDILEREEQVRLQDDSNEEANLKGIKHGKLMKFRDGQDQSLEEHFYEKRCTSSTRQNKEIKPLRCLIYI